MKTQTDKNKMEIAVSVHNQMTKNRPTFELSNAAVFAIVDRGDDVSIVELVRNPDVYSAIAEAQMGDFDYDGPTIGYAVETTGWAAPLNKDGNVEGAPSAHPERRRVRLTAIHLTDGEAASVLEFADEPGELITDEGAATGSLADALASLAA